MAEESNPSYHPPASSRWRRWVIVLLAVQGLLLALVVVALWPLIRARIAEFQEQRPQKVWVVTGAEKPFSIYVSPGLTGATACRLYEPMVTAYRVPFTWSWPRLRSLLWDRQAVEVVFDPKEPSVPWNAVNCRGFLSRTHLLGAKN